MREVYDGPPVGSFRVATGSTAAASEATGLRHLFLDVDPFNRQCCIEIRFA